MVSEEEEAVFMAQCQHSPWGALFLLILMSIPNTEPGMVFEEAVLMAQCSAFAAEYAAYSVYIHRPT